MTKEEERITKAYYEYTNRNWPSKTPWEVLMPGARGIWQERAMREYRKEKQQSS